MPSGVTHATISVAAAPAVGVYALNLTNSPTLAFCAAVGCGVVGILVTPDLDQQTRGWAENKLLRSRNIVIALFGAIHYVLWYPYALFIPHRHFLSHFPIVGTAGRLVYLASALSVVYWLVTAVMHIPLVLPAWSSISGYMTAVVAGLAVSDTLHFVADVIVSAIKKTIHKKKRKIKRR